jgi:hypothetical protein
VKLILGLLLAFGLFAGFVAPRPALAISAELAKKCRQMAFQAHPPQRVGTKTKAAAEERKFYSECLAKGGAPTENKPQSPTAPAAR